VIFIIFTVNMITLCALQTSHSSHTHKQTTNHYSALK